MSTDGLVRRAREYAAHRRHSLDDAARLVSELADEVDRLREERDGWQTLRNEWRQTAHDLAAERDAARAALERVRGLVEDGDRLDGLWTYAPDLDRALEGES